METISEEANDLPYIFSLYQDQLQQNLDRFANKQLRMRLPFLPAPVLIRIMDTAADIFKEEPTLHRLTGEFVVIGDLSGSILDLLRVIRHYGPPPLHNYLFLGNLINNGQFNTQVLGLAYVLKCVWPTNVYILRGSDEFAESADVYGLKDELDLLYGEDNGIYKAALRAFSYLPLAAVLNQEAFCVSGGIGREVANINVITTVRRPVDVSGVPIVADLMWSETTDLLPMFLPASRTYATLFGVQAATEFLHKNELKIILRGHQLAAQGCNLQMGGKVVTISTTSAFEGGSNQSGAFWFGQAGGEPHSWPPFPQLLRADVTLLASTNDQLYHVDDRPSLGPTKLFSIRSMPVCPGLRLAMSRTGAARVSNQNFAATQPIVRDVSKPRFTSPTVRNISLTFSLD
jgi:hypothetical protein